tara:strand:- start:14741 stop:16168 length:1428 start_codon:yes stop_codon:yes gene_type:complete
MATGLEQQLIKGARFAAGPVVPIGSIAAAGFEKGQKKVKTEQLAKQQADFERRKLEAENYNKKRKDSEKILSDYIKNQKTLDKPLPPNNYGQIIAEGGLKLKQFRNGVEKEIRNGNIGQADSMKAAQEGQQMLGSLSSGVSSYGEWMEIYADIDDNLSSTVGSTNINIVNSMAKGLVYEQGKDTVVKDEEGKTLYTFKDKNILDVYSPETFDELGYTPPDTAGINTLFDATQKSAQSAASKGADMTGYIKKVEQDLAQLTLTDNQYISAAFDFLGKETPGFTNPFESYIEEDMRAAFESKDPSLIKDKGGEEGNMDEIKAFVHKAMIEGAKDAYEGFKKDYADKFETGTSKDSKGAPKGDPVARAGNIYNALKKDPKSILDQIFANAKYEIINNKVQFFETDEDTKERLETDSYDLKSPSGIKGLASALSQAYYGKGQKEDLILDQFDLLVDKDPDFNFQSIIFPKITTGNLPTN